MSDKGEAVKLAQHYFRLIAQRAEVKWDGDNDVEIELMINYTVAGAKAEAVRQVRDELQALRNEIQGLQEQLDNHGTISH